MQRCDEPGRMQYKYRRNRNTWTCEHVPDHRACSVATANSTRCCKCRASSAAPTAAPAQVPGTDVFFLVGSWYGHLGSILQGVRDYVEGIPFGGQGGIAATIAHFATMAGTEAVVCPESWEPQCTGGTISASRDALIADVDWL
eukprot:gene13234-61614_t